MAFRLDNAPRTFHCAMDVTLSTVHWHFGLVYLDDIMIFLKGREGRVRHIRHVLALLPDTCVTIILKKCELFSNSNNYLGHFILPRKQAILQHTFMAIRDLNPTTNTATAVSGLVQLLSTLCA